MINVVVYVRFITIKQNKMETNKRQDYLFMLLEKGVKSSGLGGMPASPYPRHVQPLATSPPTPRAEDSTQGSPLSCSLRRGGEILGESHTVGEAGDTPPGKAL